MSDVIHVFRVVPVGELSAWQTATATADDVDGLGATTAVYTLADAIPRAITHRLGNGRVKDGQVLLLDAAGYDVNGLVQAVNLDPVLTGVLAKKQNLTQGDQLINADLFLTAHGLTKYPNAVA
jgi:hypothetical protein